MNLINKHLDKNNLHHAYLIEGKKENIEPEILEFINKSLNIKTSGNPDFYRIFIDNFKIDEALNLRMMGSEKAFSTGKKIFVEQSYKEQHLKINIQNLEKGIYLVELKNELQKSVQKFIKN